MEQEFGWGVEQNVDTGVLPYTRPWIGVFHNPPVMPDFCGRSCSPEGVLNSFYFRESLPYCRGLVTLSEYLRDWLMRRVDIPVVSLVHPTEAVKKQFSMEKFVDNPDKSVVQARAWLRKFQSLKHLPLTEYGKICINTGETGAGYQRLEELFAGPYNDDGIDVIGDYQVRDSGSENTRPLMRAPGARVPRGTRQDAARQTVLLPLPARVVGLQESARSQRTPGLPRFRGAAR